jgi:VanZ family protein
LTDSQPWRNPRRAPELSDMRARMPKQLIPRWVRAWLPAVIWATLIFSMSTDTFSAAHTGSILEPIMKWLMPSITQAQFDAVHFFIRKCAHFTEYFIFALLLYRGVRSGRGGWAWSSALAAFLIAAVYSGLDEFHQSFVASRTASPYDSLLDSTGAFFALVALLAWFRLRRRTTTHRIVPG